MTRLKPKHSLPAGILSKRDRRDVEDDGSRVHGKAPLPIEEPPRLDHGPIQSPADRARLLVDQLVSLGPNEVAPVVRQLLPLGDLALEEIVRRFPGPLWRPSLPGDSRLLRPEEISASAVALARFEEDAIPYLARLMQHSNSNVRYYATVICGAYTNTRLIEPLLRVSTDEDRQCRRVALHLLSAYRHERMYQRALARLRQCASEVAQPPTVRRRAISALTQLRDEASAPLFVDLLGDADRAIAAASRVGLRILTAHDFGFARDRWVWWLSERGREIRIQWLIEGLGDSRANVRVLASRELWHLTRFVRPLSESASRHAFLTAQRDYRRWWATTHPE